MLTTDPNRQFEELKQRLLTEIAGTFPVTDAKTGMAVHVNNLEVADSHLSTDDIRGQLAAKLSGRSYTAPVNGDVEIRDKDGKVLLSKRMKIADIPKLTRHYTFIHGGQEKSVTNQWRLLPGAYVRATAKEGEFKAQFQLAKGKSFNIEMDPESGYLYAAVGTRSVPLYSLIKANGVSDDEMRKAWGDKAFAATKAKSNYQKDLASFYSSVRKGAEAPTGTDLTGAVNKYLETTKMNPKVTQATLGTPYSSVSGEALLKAGAKLINVSSGKTQVDPIDSLAFKELWTPADHFSERLGASKTEIHSRVLKALSRDRTQEAIAAGKTTALRDVIMPDLIQRPINYTFATSLTSTPKQTNPVAMMADRSQTTIMGPGGIKSEHMLTRSNTSVDPSHLGFIDPVFTPEGSPGTTTHLAAGVVVKDRQPLSKFYNLKTGKIEDLTPTQAATTTVVMPDQIKWFKGTPTPIAPKVRVSDAKGEITEVPLSQAHYVMISPTQVFSTETNLVPFMQNDAAGRSSMSARHMAQAISVAGREAPLVQVQAAPGASFEQRIGQTFLSHTSPVGGAVSAIGADYIKIKDGSGKEHEIHLYDHYPTNDKKGMLHSTPLVKVGDSVKAGQVLADHSFTKNGTLALGANVRIAYLANGTNHEDGLVLSESAAKKLGSIHLVKPSLYTTENHVVGKKEYLSEKAPTFEPHQYTNIGDDGVIKPGTIVRPGDPLVLALKQATDPDTLDSRALERLTKKGGRIDFQNSAVTWDSEHPGEVIRVVKSGKAVTVHVKTHEPLVQGSKVSTRHAAKGIVADVRPDHEMPFFMKNGEKQHVEMLLNPVSVPGRMNPGQVLETAAAKIAEKTGQPYIVKNFDGGTDYLAKVQAELKSHGLKETENLIDPKTGRELGEITVGPHYAFQLEHQIDKKTHVRHGGAYIESLGIPKIQYDPNLVPRGGGKTGAQSLGSLGMYGALAAGLKQNLGEMQTLKSDRPQAEALWSALTNGTPLPPPEVPFVYNKFGALMRSAGLQLDKQGSMLRLVPQSDAETLKWAGGARGEVTKPGLTVAAKNMAPKGGGLFDPEIFGQDKKSWGYIKLAAPMPNPVFAEAITHLLNLPDRRSPAKNLEEIISGNLKVNGKTGAAGLHDALAGINVDSELKRLRTKIDDPKIKGADLNSAVYAHKALSALKEHGKTPAEAYTMQYLPVLPPLYRPFQAAEDKQDRIDPLNQLYRRVGLVNDTLKEQRNLGIPDKRLKKSEVDLFNEMRNLFGTTPKGKKALDVNFKGEDIKGGKGLPGILHSIAGESPKDGFFQDRVIGKKQDYTARATIVADPTLGPDEVGVPKKIAFELFRPMVANSLVKMGVNPFQAQKEISQRSSLAESALRQEIENRPVLLKRDPVLHQYGIIGQKVKLTDSRAIKVSPLVLPPINGDIDGDTVALMLPITPGAVEEAYKIMPSRRPISISTGELLHGPTNEALLSMYRMSIKKRDTNHVFPTLSEAEKAFKENKVNLDDGVTIGNAKTTLGRARVAALVPEKYHHTVLTDLQNPISKKFVTDMLKDVAVNNPNHFGDLASNLTQLGFKMAYESGHTVRLKDIEPLRDVRAGIITQAARQAAGKGDEERTQIWTDATRKLHEAYAEHHKTNPTNVSDMRQSGIKAKTEQFQGLVIAPMLVEDHLGRPSKVPITKSFAEGIDIGGYFLQSAGARKTNIQTVDAVRDPGVLTKELVQANIDSPITSMDCHTGHGINMGVNDRDVVDRYLASSVTVSGKTMPAGTLVTPGLQSSLAKANITHVFVRSPLKCQMPHGVCSRCMGVHPNGANYHLGDNVGVVAAQAIGERASQLMLRQKHAQGIMPLTKGVVDEFETVERVFGAAKPSPVDAVLAPRSAKVTRVEAQPQGGWKIFHDGGKTPMFSRQKPYDHVKPGYEFKTGDQLTHGDPNLHKLLATRGIEATQDWMVNRIGKIYEKENVLRRHVELTVRNSTGTVRVVDSGDHASILKGDHLQKTVVDEINRTALAGKRPVVVEPVVAAAPVITERKQQDWMGRLQSVDLPQHIITAAALGEKSDIHGLHPIPGLAYGQGFGDHRPTPTPRH